MKNSDKENMTNTEIIQLRLLKLRRTVWSMDVSNPTTPTYRELHTKMQIILSEIDVLINYIDELYGNGEKTVCR